jgi:hypothetical protein
MCATPLLIDGLFVFVDVCAYLVCKFILKPAKTSSIMTSFLKIAHDDYLSPRKKLVSNQFYEIVEVYGRFLECLYYEMKPIKSG